MKQNLWTILFLITTALCAQNAINIPKAEASIKLDGILDEDEWANAYTLNEFKQLEPNLGEAATERAVTKVLYDDKFLYVGVTMHYKDAADMYGLTLERDNSLVRDDYVEIHLDTYNDNTNSLVFRTNVFGAREDYEVNRNGESRNTSWNTFWDVYTNKNSNSWIAEFRIPFSSLRYQERTVNTMRFKTVLFYKSKNELIISTLKELVRTPQVYQYKNAKEISFENLPNSNPLYITPYTKANFQSNAILNEEGTGYIRENNFLQQNGFFNNSTLDRFASNVGVDVKYKPSSNHIIDFTLNTDFAEVEADDRIINITRFPIFLPEKRLFFLENEDLFNSNQFDHRLFFSRRIGINNGIPVPIIAGLRFTGSNSKWQYGAMSLQTASNTEEGLPSFNTSVARVKRIIGNRGSYIGFISTHKISNNDYNYLTALDASIRLTDNILTRFTLGSTFDKEKGNWKTVYGARINTFKANGFGVSYRFREYDEDFNPELGFVSRPNTKRITLNHGWRKTYVNHKTLRNVSVGNWTTRNWLSSDGNLDFSQTNIYSFVTFKNGINLGLIGPTYQQDNLYSPWEISDNITIPIGRYEMWKLNPRFSTGNAFLYSINLRSEFGEFYGGNQLTFSGDFTYDFSTTFSMEIGGNYNKLTLPDNFVSSGSNTILRNRYYSRLTFSLSSKAFLNSFIQYDTNSDSIGWNLRFRYTPKEGTNLFVVYNQNVNTQRNLVTPNLPVFENHGLIFKFSKTFIK